jgi:hypothetical protein
MALVLLRRTARGGPARGRPRGYSEADRLAVNRPRAQAARFVRGVDLARRGSIRAFHVNVTFGHDRRGLRIDALDGNPSTRFAGKSPVDRKSWTTSKETVAAKQPAGRIQSQRATAVEGVRPGKLVLTQKDGGWSSGASDLARRRRLEMRWTSRARFWRRPTRKAAGSRRDRNHEDEPGKTVLVPRPGGGVAAKVSGRPGPTGRGRGSRPAQAVRKASAPPCRGRPRSPRAGLAGWRAARSGAALSTPSSRSAIRFWRLASFSSAAVRSPWPSRTSSKARTGDSGRRGPWLAAPSRPRTWSS